VTSTISVSLYSSKPEHLISDDRLFKGLRPILGANLSIAHGLVLGRTNIAGGRLVIMIVKMLHKRGFLPMRPMGGPGKCLETLRLRLQSLLLGKLPRCHTDILHMSDLVSFRQTSIVHGTRIPKHEVAGIHVDLDELATSLFKPLDVLLAKEEQIHVLHFRGRCIFVVCGLTFVLKKFVE